MGGRRYWKNRQDEVSGLQHLSQDAFNHLNEKLQESFQSRNQDVASCGIKLGEQGGGGGGGELEESPYKEYVLKSENEKRHLRDFSLTWRGG